VLHNNHLLLSEISLAAVAQKPRHNEVGRDYVTCNLQPATQDNHVRSARGLPIGTRCRIVSALLASVARELASIPAERPRRHLAHHSPTAAGSRSSRSDKSLKRTGHRGSITSPTQLLCTASWPPFPSAHAALTTGRPAAALPGRVFHRLDCTSSGCGNRSWSRSRAIRECVGQATATPQLCGRWRIRLR
jgi:hypothetical protein